MKALKSYKEQSYDCWMLPSCEKSQINENWTEYKEQKHLLWIHLHFTKSSELNHIIY